MVYPIVRLYHLHWCILICLKYRWMFVIGIMLGLRLRCCRYLSYASVSDYEDYDGHAWLLCTLSWTYFIYYVIIWIYLLLYKSITIYYHNKMKLTWTGRYINTIISCHSCSSIEHTWFSPGSYCRQWTNYVPCMTLSQLVLPYHWARSCH